MMVMASNNSSQLMHELARKYPGRIGWIQGPSCWKKPHGHIPYALDNDAYIAFSRGQQWAEDAWWKMIGKAMDCGFRPLWVLVPDAVGDRELTLAKWSEFAPRLKTTGWPLAFAVQDGMTPSDVPEDAAVVFVGGTTSWKWRSLPMWTASFSRVHVGRVRTGKLVRCEQLGAESCDGTGWFRESMNGSPARFLKAYIEGTLPEQQDFALTWERRDSNVEIFGH